jgi:fructan beta-fructosidase
VEGLRYRTTSFRDRVLTPASAAWLLRDQSVETYEVQVEFELTAATSRFCFRLDTRPDGTAGAEVVYDVRAGTLMGTALPPVGNRVKVRMLVDRGQLEVFGNDGLFFRSDNPVFDQRSDSRGVALFTEGDVKLVSLDLHELA